MEETMLDSSNVSLEEDNYNCSSGSDDSEVILFDDVGFWLEYVTLIFVASVGVICNCVAIPILLSRQIASLFNRTLAFLAVFDNVYLLCEALESIRQYEVPPGYIHTMLFPYFLYPLQNIALVCSIYTTVVVALERLFAVTRPLSAYVSCSSNNGGRGDGVSGGNRGSSNLCRVILFVGPVILFSVLFNLPTFFEFYVGRASEDPSCHIEENREFSLCVSELRTNPDYVFYYINLTRIPVTGVWPLISLCVLNYMVYRRLVERRKVVEAMAPQHRRPQLLRQLRVENRQARTLFGVALLFVLGHILRIVLNLHELFAIDGVEKAEEDCASPWPLWSMIARASSRLLMTTSSSVNLFVYCAACARFRRVLRAKLFCCGRQKQQQMPRETETERNTHSVRLALLETTTKM